MSVRGSYASFCGNTPSGRAGLPSPPKTYRHPRTTAAACPERPVGIGARADQVRASASKASFAASVFGGRPPIAKRRSPTKAPATWLRGVGMGGSVSQASAAGS
jgi:hypothetical protein